MVTVERILASDPEAVALMDAMVAEVDALYGIDLRSGPSASVGDFSPPHGTFVVLREDGRAVAGGGVKRLDPGVCEIKRMYVAPEARSRGHARRLLAALEEAAGDLGHWIARLDTGPEQPHARALYESAGYRATGNFNANPFAAWWGEKDLPAVIPARFNGPPGSGHGGYSAWTAARYLDGPAEVSLRRPPPLEEPMGVVRGDGAIRLRTAAGSVAGAHGPPGGTEAEVLEAAPVSLAEVAPPGPVDVPTARAARDPSLWAPERHPFPTCFACGPRHPDGLYLYPGPLGDGRCATDWTPPGDCDAATVWAALDCPSCAPVMPGTTGRPIVLARFAVDVRSLPPAEPHVIVSEAVARDGRKLTALAALYSGSGELRALARALWIELRQ